MTPSSPATEVQKAGGPRELEQRQKNPDRVESLWAQLGPNANGELDLKGLQKGFRKIDHPLKNADVMLKKIMTEVDTNRDGKIQYEEFRIFVQKAEAQLFDLFKSIDRDGNGKLDKAELQTAFKAAGLTVSNRRLHDFFGDMDQNNDGYVTFDEWRDFLLFMPPGNQDASHLHAVLSFYYSVVDVTPEGDSLPPQELPLPPPPPPSPAQVAGTVEAELQVPVKHARGSFVDAAAHASSRGISEVEQGPSGAGAGARAAADAVAYSDGDGTSVEHREESSTGAAPTLKKYKLTDFAPHPGYFLAGAIAGGVSRTATAPLDRLKVYLLVNTNSGAETAVGALKKGRVIDALRNASRPFSEAVKDLYRSGGLRSFFAGNGLNVVKIMPETAIKFGSYEAAKRALANFEGHGDPKNINSYSKFIAGGLAGMIAQFCVYPLDTLKFRLQCETVKDGLKGSALVRQTAVKMYADGGLRACYRGVTMGLIGMFPYSAIDMGMFEFLKKTYRIRYAKYAGCHEDDAQPGNIATGIIGATSGAFGASVVYPLNVVRTRLQTQGTAMHPQTYTGIWDVTRKTIQHEGVRGLYKGLTPNLLKVAPALSITWVVYENAKRLLALN
ncbi:calcium dependent mitochondrial carrier protein, putative [Trichoderma parareesei]|uniref:Mitochondrial thiamine pyrophosphate carrier 1 n=1 Tax=Trichoderma parareesei TaxID=858221 RepID=A0A2H2ZPM7_TRIPA|nr:calcium dependent mitochondrial carrier protein, putative [Trichoderma parareesei]